jgi:hypothetical protein
MAAKTPVERRTVQEMRTTTVTKPFIIEFIINSLLFKPFKTKLQTPNDATNAQHFGSRTIWDMHQAPPLFFVLSIPPCNHHGSRRIRYTNQQPCPLVPRTKKTTKGLASARRETPRGFGFGQINKKPQRLIF